MAPVRRRVPTVLVVDDHDDTRAIYVQALAQAGLDSHPASTALEALRLTDVHDFDVIVVDIGLPGPTGIHLAHELRTRPRTKQAILIAVSGFPKEVGNDPAFDSYLMKPCLPWQLLEEIRRVERRADRTGRISA